MSSVSSNSGSYPPQTNIASVLASGGSSTLATSAFADPNSGVTDGLHAAAAINDNHAGRFSLASGITVAGSAVSNAIHAVKNIQQTVNELQKNVAALDDPNTNETIRQDSRAQLELNLKKLRELLGSADVAGVNLLDNRNSDGVTLDVNSGTFTSVGKTPDQNVVGTDQRLAYRANSIAYQTPDLSAALDNLDNLLVTTATGGNDDSGPSGLSAITRFQNSLNQASTSLNTFKNNLSDTANQKLTVNFEGSDIGVNDSAGARQIASRLALELHQTSFNITANPAIRFFSLFA